MQLERGIELLTKLKLNFQKLLEIAETKHSSLFLQTPVQLQELVIREEKVLFSIQTLEKERFSFMKNLGVYHEQGKNNNHLNDFAELLLTVADSDQAARILELSGEITGMAKRIMSLNQRNIFLINQMRSINAEFVKAIFGEKKTILLDRKA